MIARLLVLVLATASSCANDCVPGVVRNLAVDHIANLTWNVDPNEPCPIEGFRVEVVGEDGIAALFRSSLNYIHLSFLDFCQEWQFTVAPISNGVVGFEHRLTDYIPIRQDANLTLTNLRVTHLGGKNTSLQWEMAEPFRGDCTLRYRVLVRDRQTSTSHSVYVTGRSAYLDTLAPCVPYLVSIRAVSTSLPIIEGPLAYTTFDIEAFPEDPPTLLSVDAGTTTVKMVWQLEDYMKNRCPVVNLHVDGGDFFNVTVPIEDPYYRKPVSVNLTRLHPDRMYYMKVAAENSGGISTSVPLGVQTLPLERDGEYDNLAAAGFQFQGLHRDLSWW
ncbi:hypothetical protein NQ315_001350 [Exocentrus adspersus]|uniref:Fibronectin type-III domain-containing protein n=1 Tax=Exocentrus adspersus TaxID=1586481 RepID=A0AAV8WEK9_9CUCU|nr:hypothetical protein NQ315_001350 [Exocentrus adspersus]